MSIFEKATALESKTRPKRHRYLPNELKIKKGAAGACDQSVFAV
jgi:hypothetical protein